MSDYTFDIPKFRIDFPEFADVDKYPDAVLNRYWVTATCFVSDKNAGVLHGDCRYLVLTLMVAHLARLAELIARGIKTGRPLAYTTSASVGAVSVSLSVPQSASQFEWWLNLTPYGSELLALLSALSAGGFYLDVFSKETGVYMR